MSVTPDTQLPREWIEVAVRAFWSEHAHVGTLDVAVRDAIEAVAPLIAEARTREIVEWLRHIDRLDEVPGAGDLMPRKNPLWDAADAIEREFSAAYVPVVPASELAALRRERDKWRRERDEYREGWLLRGRQMTEDRARLARVREAGDRLAEEVERRWSGPDGCDCAVCSAAASWRALTEGTCTQCGDTVPCPRDRIAPGGTCGHPSYLGTDVHPGRALTEGEGER